LASKAAESIPSTILSAHSFVHLILHSLLRVAVQVAETLATAHGRPVQVLHRDIKPGNVLLDSANDLNPVLTDFDLAWIESRHTQLTKQLYSNLHYGAPEQFEPRWKEFRQRPTVDVYSLGALTYYLLLKQAPPPWHAWSDEHWSILEERLENQLDAPVVLRLERLLRSMLVPDPSKRLGRMDDAAAGLSRASALAETGGGKTTQEEWSQQVCYKVTGRSQEKGTSFVSRTGRISWKLRTNHRRTSFDVAAEATLLGRPSFEGVDYQGYRVTAARRIDDRLRAFERAWEGVRAFRTGFPTENSSAKIAVEGLACTLESASAVGQLISQINMAIE
jgi:serine/threonine protein kinase